MECYPLVRKVFCGLIPAGKIRFRYHIYLGPFLCAGSTAVVMLAAKRGIIGHDKEGNGIGNEVDLNVIVVPLSPSWFVSVIDVPVNNDTVVEANWDFGLEESLHRRIKETTDVVCRSFPAFLAGEQSGDPQHKPSLLSEPYLYGDGFSHVLLNCQTAVRRAGVGGKLSVADGQLFGKQLVLRCHVICFLLMAILIGK